MQTTFGLPQLGYKPVRRIGLYERVIKRMCDVVVVLALTPIWVPLLVCLAVVSWLDRGQAFYKEKRVGRYGREFNCWKIRTLHPGAARKNASHKKMVDPRSSRFGRFLRRSSLDELPQLFSVLVGHMSLVGPRPVPQNELASYGPARQSYLSARPGLTGLWQVSGRNTVSYEQRVFLDRKYCRNVSLTTDLNCLVATLREIWTLSGL